LRAAVHANMAHGTSIRIEKRQFRPGAGGNNRRSQPSNPLHSSDRECWDQLRGTARHYSRRLQQLVLGRLTLIWAAFFWSPRDLFAPPHPTLLRRTQWVKAVHQLLEFGLLFFRKRLSCFHSLRRNSSQRARAAFTGLHAKAALPYKCISEVENGQYDCFWRPVGRLRHDAKLGRLRVALRPRTDVPISTSVRGRGRCGGGGPPCRRSPGARRTQVTTTSRSCIRLVSSINRPTGNVTGIAPMFTLLGTKNLELLHELVPPARVISLRRSRATPPVRTANALPDSAGHFHNRSMAAA